MEGGSNTVCLIYSYLTFIARNLLSILEYIYYQILSDL